MEAKKHTFYCIAFRLWGVAICGVFDTLESFTGEISTLFSVYQAPSQIDTCSIIAYTEKEAYEKAVEYFNKNGWNIKGAE